MTDTVMRDVALAFVRVHLLHHAAAGPVFGLEMIEELRHHGYALSPGTLYPILHGLERSGYLKSSAETTNGRQRRYYRATARGRRALASLKSKLGELVDEVLED